MTLMSCMDRPDMPADGWRTICSWTSVSTSSRGTTRDDLRVADVRLDPLEPFEPPLRRSRVESRHVRELGICCEPFGQQRAEVAPDAGDQDPAAGH